MKIGFLVGDIVHISGGSNVIIEHAAGLRALGHEVTLIPPTPPEPAGGSWHPKLKGLSIRHLDDCRRERFDFLFATWWLTWFDLHQLEATVYGYFNQSYESRFHPERHYKLQNRATYSLPLFFVTEAHWLERFIAHLQPDARVAYVPNGLSSEYFAGPRTPSARKGPLRVIVEGPWGVPFKGVKEAFELLQVAAERTPLEVGWLTSYAGGQKPVIGQRPVRIWERIGIHEVAEVLRQHDVMLKLSSVEGMYGPPLEMFSQGGTAITTPVSGCDEYVVHGQNALLAPTSDPLAAVRYLHQLSEHDDVLTMLRTNALATARQWPDWRTATGQFAAALEASARSGYTNAHLRPALASVSAMRTHWLDDVWRFEAEQRSAPHLGEGEWLLMKRYRELKASNTVQSLKRFSPPAVREVLREYAMKVLE
ncbi:MAG: glycosyltransferase family 4 protein [Myxococcaceae bacterium]|nr:glycosyltransferase family 4 protein [Myxococcaceae bacterium]